MESIYIYMCVCNIHPKNGDVSHLVIRNGAKPHERLRKNYAVIKKWMGHQILGTYWGRWWSTMDNSRFFRTNPYEFILSMNHSETIKCRKTWKNHNQGFGVELMNIEPRRRLGCVLPRWGCKLEFRGWSDPGLEGRHRRPKGVRLLKY